MGRAVADALACLEYVGLVNVRVRPGREYRLNQRGVRYLADIRPPPLPPRPVPVWVPESRLVLSGG